MNVVIMGCGRVGSELTVELSKDTTYEAICAAMKSASQGAMKGVLGYTEEKVVSTDFRGEAMTYAEMLDYVRKVKARGRPVPADAPRQVVALEVLDQVAAAKVVAWWGTDFLHLARIDGRWMITQVIWQSPPANGP